MKVYCINEKCPNHNKGYAICTALMDVTECPERKKEAQPYEENRQSDSDIQVQS